MAPDSHAGVSHKDSRFDLLALEREEKLRYERTLLALLEERDFSNAVLNGLPGIFYHFEDSGRFLRWNKNFERVSGYAAEELAQMHALDFFDDEEKALVASRIAEVYEKGESQVEANLRLKDGRRIPHFFTGVQFEQNGRKGFIGVALDMTWRKSAEERLREERDFSNTVLNSLPGVFYQFDDNLRFLRWNKNLEKVTGYRSEELAAMHPLDFVAEQERQLMGDRIGEVFETGESRFETDYVLKGGRSVPYVFTSTRIDYGGRRGFVGVGFDISERRQAEERIHYLATHDGLTGLPNRHLIQDRIAQAITSAQRTGRKLGLLYLDLDRFKILNDGYGHAFGDAVLKAAAERLVSSVRSSDTVARLGGDEFLILLTNLRRPADAHIVTERVRSNLYRPVTVLGHEVHLSGSIGVSIFPEDGETTETLIGNADVAMYRAKSLGRNTYQFFTREMSEETQRRVDLETKLRGAAAAGQLTLAYQPKVSLVTGRITGCEALLRWHHPELGVIPPSRFIPIAEESGLIVPIGDWVLRAACEQAKAWTDAGLPPICVAVNISARQFLQRDALGWVLRTLEETRLPPAQLELELTESLIAQDVEKVLTTMSQFKAAGVKLSIDDFGTGYSSLSYLKRFSVDTLKIDQSFVRNMVNDPDNATIVLAIIALAHNLKLKVIAEGVETEEHCRFLRLNRCDEMQGYHFSKPVPAADFEAMLREDKRLTSAGKYRDA